ncbi:MAG: thioredoxin family protein [Kiritimatiellae bacterium]|nr:thioredoxin family protein [Kiritimatiellia bacterium]
MKRLTIFLLMALAGFSVLAQFGRSPFGVRLVAGEKTVDGVELSVQLDIPAEHMIYYESFSVKAAEGFKLELVKAPKIEEKPDLLDPDTIVKVFAHSMEATYKLSPAGEGAVVTVDYQGCDKATCFMPESHQFRFSQGKFEKHDAGEQPAEIAEVATAVNPWTSGMQLETAGGYMSAADFLAFLDKVEGREPAETAGFKGFLNDPVSFLQKHGMVLTLILVLLGGLLLNMTPCVLPMIPINLAIIGAGAGTRTKGFTLGSAYGLGIVTVYGGLGWVILRSGIFFGAIQSSPWFNLVIGVVFVLLSLALFDLFIIDFAALITPKAGEGQRKGIAAAFGAGALSALLAGACVAPVVLAVLLLAGNLYGKGVVSAQFLPFVLGAGMALPWPFAGAGLSVLPGPGMWMVRVKQFFGVFLLILAGYYLYVAGSGFLRGSEAREGSILAGDQIAWAAKLDEARSAGKPIFLDFWATWCKNCSVMEQKTFKDEEVVKRLQNYVVVKVQAETPDKSPAKEMLAAFGVRGLPGFAILKNEK